MAARPGEAGGAMGTAGGVRGTAPRIDPIEPRLRWDVLSRADIERMDAAIMEVLAEVGVRFPLERALDALERGGCRVDRESQIARLPESIVRAALQAAPKAPLLAARDPQCDLILDGRRCYLSNDGCGVWVIDPESGERRPSTKDDVAASARFVDAVPEVSYYWGPVVTAEDVPLASRPLHELEAIFASTSKHFQAVDVVGEGMARRAVEMARVVAGGAEELRRRPLMSLIACPIDPLSNEAVSLEAALVCAEAGVPVGFLSLTLACASAPATMAGNLVVNLAAVIAGTVLLQLASPGAPVFLAGAPSVMDLKTGGYTGGSPEDYLLAAAATQMAHHYELAMAMGTQATGAKEPGWQAAVDDALSTLASVSAGAEMMNGCGLLDGSKALSYAHLLMEAEVYGIVQKVAGGIEVSDETLALDVIRRVGPNGTYLAEKHTRTHMGEIWRPGVWDRSSYDAWLAAGKRGALQNAEERAREILRTHAPEPLPDDVLAELRRLVERAEDELL
ncbi:MAG TPA: trimethylamine methyltransferase family protein [Thermoleophilia bacterium]|nr:trimethylamine methyltransferase family protein [Thermoleophilia bacterium]